ncbi:HAD family hydrolase [Bacteroidota bacterium]
MGTGLIDTKGIRNIILDLGGVILELDVNSTIRAFHKLGFPPLQSSEMILSKHPFFLDFEIGEISGEEFIDRVIGISSNHVTREKTIHAWNAMIQGFQKDSIKLLLELRRKYRLFLLSNTNAIHEVHYNSQLAQDHGIANLDEIFEKVYYSHKLKMRKPNLSIFKHVLSDSGLSPTQSLFIDDTLVNIDAAHSLGIKTHHLLAPERITDIL